METFLYNYLLSNSGFIGAAVGVVLLILYALLLLPYIQALLVYEKQKWQVTSSPMNEVSETNSTFKEDTE